MTSVSLWLFNCIVVEAANEFEEDRIFGKDPCCYLDLFSCFRSECSLDLNFGIFPRVDHLQEFDIASICQQHIFFRYNIGDLFHDVNKANARHNRLSGKMAGENLMGGIEGDDGGKFFPLHFEFADCK